MHLTMTKSELLKNKVQQTSMLDEALGKNNCKSFPFHASADADLLIVKKAVESAAKIDAVLVSDDRDLLILVLLCNFGVKQLVFQTRRKIYEALEHAGCIKSAWAELCHHVLLFFFFFSFLHAILGCGTTSSLHGIGKGIL